MQRIHHILLLFFSFTLLQCSKKETKEVSDEKFVIAYNVFIGSNGDKDDYDIFTMEFDGSNKTNITKNADVAWTYLANNDEIFFISDRDTTYRTYFLYVMKADGSQVNKISRFPLQDSWMGSRNNGEEIVVKPYKSIDSVLTIINRKGEIVQKVNTPTLSASDPAFSPDGSFIAFIGANKKDRKDPNFRSEIYSVKPDGSELKQLTHYPENDTTAKWYSYRAGPPRFHPTEDFISYQSYQNGKYSLYAVSVDGNRQWKLTDHDMQEGWHDWSPDGKWLAIELFDTEQTQFHIGLMNWQTKELQVLTDTSYAYQQAPVFVKMKN